MLLAAALTEGGSNANPCNQRTTGGFCVIYFQLMWIATTGPGVSFGCQAMVLAVAFLAGVVTTQIWGRKWRLKYPAPAIEN